MILHNCSFYGRVTIFNELVCKQIFKVNAYVNSTTYKYLLHAVSLANIMTFNVQKITNAAWNLKQDNILRKDMLWPQSPTEFPDSWLLLWQTALRECFGNNIYQENACKICILLGNWYNTAVEEQWNVCVSQEEGRVYICLGENWKVYTA